MATNLDEIDRPIIVTQNLAKFFTTANLGLIDNLTPWSVNNPTINDSLDLLDEYGMTNVNILTTLFFDLFQQI